jgi:hypothetical protein
MPSKSSIRNGSKFTVDSRDGPHFEPLWICATLYLSGMLELPSVWRRFPPNLPSTRTKRQRFSGILSALYDTILLLLDTKDNRVYKKLIRCYFKEEDIGGGPFRLHLVSDAVISSSCCLSTGRMCMLEVSICHMFKSTAISFSPVQGGRHGCVIQAAAYGANLDMVRLLLETGAT